MEQTKRCPDCGREKPLQEFTLNKRRSDGRGTYCRSCFNERSRRHRENRAATEGRRVKRRRQVPDGSKYCPRCETIQPKENFGNNRGAGDGLTAYCRPCHNEVTRKGVEKLHGSTRDYHLRRRYGITAADVEAMIEAQGGTCAVCQGKPEHVDHDHQTNQVRGILCFNCNQALGNVRDDPDVLLGLVDYLASNGRHATRRREAPPLVAEVYPYRGPVVFEADTYRHRAA